MLIDSPTLKLAITLFDQVSVRSLTLLQREILRFLIRISYGQGCQRARIPHLSSFGIIGISKGHVREALDRLATAGVLRLDRQANEFTVEADPRVWRIPFLKEDSPKQWSILLMSSQCAEPDGIVQTLPQQDTGAFPGHVSDGPSGINYPTLPNEAPRPEWQGNAMELGNNSFLHGSEGALNVALCISSANNMNSPRNGVLPSRNSDVSSGNSDVPTGNSVVPTGNSVVPTGNIPSHARARRSSFPMSFSSPVDDAVDDSLTLHNKNIQEPLAWVEGTFRKVTGRRFNAIELPSVVRTLVRLGGDAERAPRILEDISRRYEPKYPGDRIRSWQYFELAFESLIARRDVGSGMDRAVFTAVKHRQSNASARRALGATSVRERETSDPYLQMWRQRLRFSLQQAISQRDDMGAATSVEEGPLTLLDHKSSGETLHSEPVPCNDLAS